MKSVIYKLALLLCICSYLCTSCKPTGKDGIEAKTQKQKEDSTVRANWKPPTPADSKPQDSIQRKTQQERIEELTRLQNDPPEFMKKRGEMLSSLLCTCKKNATTATDKERCVKQMDEAYQKTIERLKTESEKQSLTTAYQAGKANCP